MRLIAFLFLFISINSIGQTKKITKNIEESGTPIVSSNGKPIPLGSIKYISGATYSGSMFSHVQTLVETGDAKAPLLLVYNDTGKEIAYLTDTALVITDSLATINQLIKHIFAQERSLQGVMKELDAAYTRNRKLIKAYSEAADTQKKAWKELMDKLTVKK